MDRAAGYTLIRLFLLFLIASHAYMGVFDKRGWLDWRRIVNQNALLEHQIKSANEEKQALENKIRAIQSSEVEREQMVRKVLGYIRPNETVIEFD